MNHGIGQSRKLGRHQPTHLGAVGGRLTPTLRFCSGHHRTHQHARQQFVSRLFLQVLDLGVQLQHVVVPAIEQRNLRQHAEVLALRSFVCNVIARQQAGRVLPHRLRQWVEACVVAQQLDQIAACGVGEAGQVVRAVDALFGGDRPG